MDMASVVPLVMMISSGEIQGLVFFYPEAIHFPLAATGPFIYLVLCGLIIGHTVMLVLVRDAGPVFASGGLYVSLVIATALGVLGESIRASSVLGTVLALAGIFVLGWAEKSE